MVVDGWLDELFRELKEWGVSVEGKLGTKGAGAYKVEVRRTIATRGSGPAAVTFCNG